jgi:ABC-type sugar transport system ATPase subunit
MREGRLEQVAPPLTLYRNPVNTWVANFVSLQPLNLVPAELSDDGSAVKLLGGSALLDCPLPGLPGRFVLGVRSENLRLSATSEGSLKVLTTETVGEQVKYTVAAPDGSQLVALGGADTVLAPGTGVRLIVDWTRAMIFDRESELRLDVPTAVPVG